MPMQQLFLEFKTENEIIPLAYSSALLSFLKHAIEENSPNLYHLWFGTPESIRKCFTFSCRLPEPTFDIAHEQIILKKNSFSLRFSTSDITSFMELYNAFLVQRRKWYPMGQNTIMLVEVKALPIPKIRTSCVTIRMESPLLVRVHNRANNRDRFLDASHEDFSSVLKTNTESLLEKLGLFYSTEGFLITPLEPKKTVIPHFGLRVNANLGVYQLQGSPELLNWLLLSGLGSSTASGHGKFQVID